LCRFEKTRMPVNKTLPILLPDSPTKKLNHVLILLAFLFLFQPLLHAQLPSFTLTITKTDETCLGNGTLTFSVAGNDPTASIQYKIFQFPDVVNAIAVQSTNFLGGRTAGTYRIVATQSLNGEFNSQTQDITIDNQIVPLTYTIASTNALCGSDASMTVTITSGIGAQYEIISGPITRPIQSSPVFNLIPAGEYGVRVYDNCGVAWVTTHIVISDAMQISISPVAFPSKELATCNTIAVSNTLSASSGDSLTYPIFVQYSVFPPDGSAAIITNTTITSGAADNQEVQTVIPFYYDQPYYYTITVTDHCGNVYTMTDNLVNEKLTVILSAEEAKCGQKFLTVRPSMYKNPIIVTWLAAPTDFNPVAFNTGHPGPFNSAPIAYGDFDMPVPWGHYVVQIDDGCGHTAQAEVTLEYEEPEPTADIDPYDGCQSNFSDVTVQIPGFTIVSAIITIAPPAYPNTIPEDVTALIDPEEGLQLTHLITGDYTVHLVDDCNNVYDYPFFVPDTATSVSNAAMVDCAVGKGAIRIRGNSTILTSAIMTAAPASFSATFPYDVTFNISGAGVFSMGGLPAGSYSFDVVDSCGLSHSLTVVVTEYEVTGNDFSLTPHCGSFDFSLAYASNGSGSFWLQKFNPVTNGWGHPGTGSPYIEGSIPNGSNSYAVNNNTTTLNLIFTGMFRIIKFSTSFENGENGEFKSCFEIIKEFEYTGIFQIIGFEKVTCSGALADIKVLTNGVPPLTYKITKKNGFPFFIDNGNNNVFTNLDQAIYTFEVQHACGHIATGDADVAQLPSLANANQPDDMQTCDDISNDGLDTFLLSDQDAAILGSQNPADYTLTYHLSASDAALGVNPLPQNTTYTSGNTTIYARLKYNGNSDCYDVTSFELIVHPYPVPDMKQVWALCEGQNVTITAEPGFDAYLWSTGQTTQSITVSQPGIYTLTVTEGNCQGVFPIEVIQSNAPTIHHIETADWTQNDNSITVILGGTGVGDYVYSLDNIHFHASNTFTGLPPGAYTIYVKDLNECGGAAETIFLLAYPRFFTPNGDGFNDHWKVTFSETEPHLMTYVFDRYGKLITGFLPDSLGWDGTLNGEPLPSTDYWFLVIREDGKEFRGHFAMKR
jgi:gliding motility-associated-like protein